MIKSILTTTSTNMTESRHNSAKQHTATGFTRRALLLVSFLMIGLGSTWGQEYDENDLPNNGNQILRKDYEKYDEESLVVFTLKVTQQSIWSNSEFTISNLWSGSPEKFTIDSDATSPYEIFADDLFTITCPLKKIMDMNKSQNTDGVQISGPWNTTLEYVKVKVPKPDEFINTGKNVIAGAGSKRVDDRNFGSESFNFSDIAIKGANLSGVTYARIYVTDADGSKLDYDTKADGTNDLLEVTGSVSAGIYKKNGLYVYNNGTSLSDFTVTLNAGEGKLDKYKIVVLLSTESTGAMPNKEPQWNYEYTFTFIYPAEEIYRLLDESEIEGSSVEVKDNNIMNEILSKLNLNSYNFAQHWYACWYVEDKDGAKQDVQPNMGDNSKWTVKINNNGGNWEVCNNKILWLDDTKQNARNDWFINQHLASNISIIPPANTTLSKCAGYKIIFKVTNEYEGNYVDPSNPPEAKFCYIFEIPITFSGELRNGIPKEETQKVSSRQNDSCEITWENTKADMSSPKYVRFYLTDNEGNVVSPGGKLEVTYNNGTNSVYTCKNANHGFYIYDNDNDNGLSWDNIHVQLKAREMYKLYKVVGVFASNTEGKILAEDDSNQALAREPDWDLQYIYSFTYSPETKEYKEEIEWRGNGMTPTASVSDPNNANEWNISWKELSLGYCVKWYVVKGNEQQSLVLGTARQANNWVINLPSPFTIQDNKEAVLKGQTMFTSDQWNIWGKPTVYAPSITDYEDDYQIVCEVYSNSDDTGEPNAKYIFKLYKSFLGEINEGVEPVNKVRILEDRLATTTELALSDVLAEYTGEVLYARVWLTKTNGTEVEPQGRLSADGMTPYTNNTTTNTYSTYGFYLTGNDDIAGQLNNISAKLELTAGSFCQYQIHVAFSKNALPNDLSGEPNYDFVYVLSFDYPAKIVYKELIINKDGKYIPDLLENWQEVAKDCEVEDQQTLQQKLYVRWYLANADGIIIQSDFGFSSYSYTGINDNNGYYRFGDFNFADWNKATYNPTIDLPDEYDRKNVRLVCVATTKTDGYNATPWTEDPELQVKYIYTFYTDDDMKARPFVHYQGQAYRYLKEVLKNDERAKERDYIKMGSNVPTNNLTWDISTETSVETTENIRQNVHTWEYDIYVVPGEARSLMLPFQYYDTSNGQDLEPRAYIRWYDWNTDEKVITDGTFSFTKKGSRMYEHDRGLFNLCLPNNPIYEDSGGKYGVGVEFTPNANFSGTIDIACDVSKYSDGIVKYSSGYTEESNKYYLLHEPTLSNRYIFHIRPANIIAKKLADAKTALGDAEQHAEDGKDERQAWYDAMSALEEDKGKVVVSVSDNQSQFALRFDHHNLLNYILYNGSEYVSADQAQWYAYFEDENGKIWKKEITGSNDGTGRITTFTYYNNFLDNNGYKDLQGNDRPYNAKNGKIFHVVGHVLNSEHELSAPVVHYELHFINAPAVKLDDIIKNPAANKERTEEYMRYYYDLAGIVDFDGNPKTNPDVIGHEAEYFSTQNWSDVPTSKDENMTHVPFHWSNIQYGFCYPELTYTVKNGWGVGLSPIHGDYIVLKSMNMPGVSEAPGITQASAPNEYHWWNKNELYDYTYYATEKRKEGHQYGSFLYTDASDESRTIASIPFNAELCNGSSIYFTMLVADMTSETVKPQLLIRIVGIDDKGNRQRIVAFHTGVLYVPGEWYQVYGASTLPTNFNTNITQFEAEVINYANGTQGADFAIDQLMIYTSTAKVLLTQTGSNNCDDNTADDENKVQVYMAGEGLQNAFGTKDELQPIYWRICEEETNRVITGTDMYPRYDNSGTETKDDGTFTYGITWVNPSEMKGTNNTTIPAAYGWYKVGEQFFFQLANKGFSALEEGKNYYVSVFNPNYEFVESNAAGWGNPDDICSIYSEFFIPRRQYVTFISPTSKDGEEGGEITIPCGSTDGAKVSGVVMILKVPDENEITGFRDEKIAFDYILLSKNEWHSDAGLGTDRLYTYNELCEALADYRKHYSTGKELNNSYQNDRYLPILQDAIKAKLLILAASENFEYTFNQAGTHYVTCIPVNDKIDDETTICGPFEVIFKLKGSGGPSLTLGFEEITTYPTGIRVVRVGKEQLDNMQNTEMGKGFLLHIPVNTYKTDPDATEKTGALEIVSSFLQLIKRGEGSNPTNDPMVSDQKNVNVAIFEGDKVISKENNKMYISINFHDAIITNKPTFHEGFTYHMFFQVKKKDAEDGACETPVEFLIKVVPEYVTWNDGSVTEESNVNANWNRDENWSRSKRTELYKGTTNTASKGHPDGYKDNGDLSITTTPAAFVPMKFTYVTMPSDNIAPNLLNLEIGSEGIYNNIGTGTTDDIVYDLMVRYTETKCIDSKHSENGTGNIYDCEKFYGNWAKEIYFKPGAELVNQHYLTYEKVWVEKELEAGKWTLMSTPLQNTYAGDMYVPVGGRQETEAFKDITFGLTDYSRTKYPIYQRSWGMNEGKVYTKSEDVRNTDYSALLKFPTKTVETIFAEWSHTFNDVWVDYSTWKGFAVRAHKSDYTGTRRNNALLRLPKADNSYQYYDWNDYYNEQQPTMPDDKTLGRGKYGKLFTDSDNAGNITYGVIYGTQARTTKDNAEVTVPVGKVQEVDGYLLVGNPYLCSIDMAVFLKTNENILENKYWTYEGNTTSSQLSNGKIQPLQSFFVRKLANTTTNDIKFTSAMMVGNGGVPKVMPKPMMTMTATNDRGKSTATVSVGDEARSVETLFDSNLNDVPMVYTVAEGQAVSINQLPEFDKPIAFGVTCTASNEPVAVTFTDIAQLTSGDVFVVDAVTGEQTAVGEGSSVSVQPNDYGRYFLLPGTMGINDKTAVQKGIVVSIRDRRVTITSGEALTLVRATLLDGTTAYQYTGGDTTASFTLTSGVYIIHAENAAGEQQKAKVIVK